MKTEGNKLIQKILSTLSDEVIKTTELQKIHITSRTITYSSSSSTRATSKTTTISNSNGTIRYSSS